MMKNFCLILILLTFFSFKVADNRSIYTIPLQARAVSSVDYDLDGDNDIIIAHGIDKYDNWGGIYMLQNDGYGHFAFMDSIYDTIGGFLFADTVISSPNPDILYSYAGYLNVLSRKDEMYVHNSFYMGTNLYRITTGNINNDTFLDVAIISNLDWYWGVLYNNGNGSFTIPENFNLNFHPLDIDIGELNDDGKGDVVIVGEYLQIYYNSDSGFVIDSLPESALRVKITDFDLDGNNDIITFHDKWSISSVYLYENQGNGSFNLVSNFNVNKGCSEFYIEDFNNDGLPDVLFQHHAYPAGFILYFNQGAFQFGEPVDIDLINYGEARKYACVEDMDGNSFVDIVVTRTVYDTTIAPSLLEILFNDGHGNFVENPLTNIEDFNLGKNSVMCCYPNPFTAQTTFEFTIQETSQIELSVFNLQGQLVKSLINKTMKGGRHQVKWDGLDNAGQACKPGSYIAYLKVNGSFIQSIKLIIH